jgi:hypothetical protein
MKLVNVVLVNLLCTLVRMLGQYKTRITTEDQRLFHFVGAFRLLEFIHCTLVDAH